MQNINSADWTRIYCDLPPSLPIPLHLPPSLSLSFLFMPGLLLSWRGPSLFWQSPCCKVPISPSITVIGSDFLHRGSAPPEGPAEPHIGTHNHTHLYTQPCTKFLLGMWSTPDISFSPLYLFISVCSSIHWPLSAGRLSAR